MVKRCVVQFCSNTSKEQSLHSFPKDDMLRRQWVRFVQTKRADFKTPTETSQAVICGAHFKPECFEGAQMALLGFEVKKKNLKPGSVPTIHVEPTAEQLLVAKGAKRPVSASSPPPVKMPRQSRAIHKREVLQHFVDGNGPTKEHPDPIPAEGITDRRQIPNKQKPCERANRRNFPPSKKVQPLQENTLLNTDPSEHIRKTEVTVSTVGLDSQTEGECIVASISQSQMASPSYHSMRLDGIYDSFSDPYSQSETFSPAEQCLSPVCSSGEVKAEFEFESTNYTIDEPKRRLIKSEGIELGIEWNCAGEMIKEETHRLFNIKQEEEESEEMVKLMMKENPECGMTTKEKYRTRCLKIEEEGEDEEVEESEERRIVKIELDEDVGENMGFRIKKEEVIEEYEEPGGTDLNFPTNRCEGKGGESESNQQKGELSLSSLVTECLLRQPRVLIKQPNITGFSVTVSPFHCSMANTEDQGLRSPLGPGKLMSCKRKKTRQTERTQTLLPASLEDGLCINASHNPLDSSYWSQSKGETIEASSPVFVCSLCSFVHADKVNFLQHIEKVHPAGQRAALVSVDGDAENPTNRGSYQRPKTPKTYTTSPQPRSGTSGDRIQQNLCSQCGKSFKYKSLLAAHQRIHTGERPYQCSLCGQNFMLLAHLVAHQRTHTGVRPYRCSQCEKDFGRSDSLKRHQRTHTKERPYHCAQCGKKFGELNCLIIHQRTHTGERPYQCSECGKSFIHSTYLIRHQQNHSEKGPVLCSQRGKAFRNLGLQVDLQTHTGEHLYHCPQCGEDFIRFSALWKHQKTHTK